MKLGGYKSEILAQNKYKSRKSRNPFVQQASTKVAKWEEAGQEALVKLFWVKIFLQLVQTRCPRMGGSNYTQFYLPTFFLAAKMTFEVKIPLF